MYGAKSMTHSPIKKDSEAAQFIVNTYKVAFASTTGVTEDQAGAIVRDALDSIIESKCPPETVEELAQRLDDVLQVAKFGIKVVTPGATAEQRKKWFKERREALDAFFSQSLVAQLRAKDDPNSRFYLDGPWVIDRLNAALKP